MSKIIRNGNKGNGFSVIEILISIAVISAVFSAIAVKYIENPQISDNRTIIADNNNEIIEVTGSETIQIQEEAESAARQVELSIVQTAMDTMMIRKQFSEVSMSYNTRDMSKFPKDNGLYPEYLRFTETKYEYSCNEEGQVSQR